MNEREALRRKLQEKYHKPVFFVSELIYCPHYKTRVPESIVNEKMREGEKYHRMIQRYFVNRFRHYDAELQLELDREKYILVGHADLVDHKDHVVIEIKPHLGRDIRHIYQLSAYVAMFNEIYKANYYGEFLIYYHDKYRGTLKWKRVRPLYLVMHILSILDKVAEIKLEKEQIRIATMMCNECIHRDTCKPDIRLDHNEGYLDATIPEKDK